MRACKKIVLLIALLGVLISGLVAGREGPVLRLGILPVIDTLPLIVARERGLFKEEGIKVEIINFNSTLEEEAVFLGNKIMAMSQRPAQAKIIIANPKAGHASHRSDDTFFAMCRRIMETVEKT